MASDQDVFNSITRGEKTYYAKTGFQAICARISLPEHLESLLMHLSKDHKLDAVTDKILAFRTEDEEGFDDGSTLAAGEKLLHMLERMNVDNCVVMVFLWDYGYVGKTGTQLFKVVLDKARALLLQIYSNLPPAQPKKQPGKTKSQHFSFAPLPDPHSLINDNRKSHRPRHFLNEVHRERPCTPFEAPEITEEELHAAVSQVENSLRHLTQSDVIDLRKITQTSPAGRVLQMVSLLKGYSAPTWANTREMLESRTFKVELSLIDVHKLTARQINSVRKILREHRNLNVKTVSQASVPAATLLSWVEGIVTWFTGRNLLKVTHNNVLESSGKDSELPLDEELQQKLERTREAQEQYQQRVNRVLQNRLEDLDFEGEPVEVNDEDVMKYISGQNISDQPTAVLLAIVRNLKSKRM